MHLLVYKYGGLGLKISIFYIFKCKNLSIEETEYLGDFDSIFDKGLTPRIDGMFE
jgi:hypothetical protein